jgi:NADH dehydrogenase (ubiquinone) 1 alpha subcomplex subunit 2
MSKIFKFSSRLKELRLHLCQTTAASAGARNFIEKYYVDIKKANATTPILIRECSNIEPKLWARYEFGKETNLSLANLNEEQVFKALEKLAK